MNRKQILTIAFIVDSLCWIALGFLIVFSTNATGGTMSITAETNNPQPIEVGAQVIYVCPWTGFDRLGHIVGTCENNTFGEDYYDIESDDGTGLDVVIHLTDIRPID